MKNEIPLHNHCIVPQKALSYPRLGTPLVKLPTAPPTTSSDGHEIELSEFQSDRPPTVHYHSLNRGRGRSIKHDKLPAYRQ